MECTVSWTGLTGMSFLATTGSGHTAVMDGAVEGGGTNLAPRPYGPYYLALGPNLSGP